MVPAQALFQARAGTLVELPTLRKLARVFVAMLDYNGIYNTETTMFVN